MPWAMLCCLCKSDRHLAKNGHYSWNREPVIYYAPADPVWPEPALSDISTASVARDSDVPSVPDTALAVIVTPNETPTTADGDALSVSDTAVAAIGTPNESPTTADGDVPSVSDTALAAIGTPNESSAIANVRTPMDDIIPSVPDALLAEVASLENHMEEIPASISDSQLVDLADNAPNDVHITTPLPDDSDDVSNDLCMSDDEKEDQAPVYTPQLFTPTPSLPAFALALAAMGRKATRPQLPSV